MPIDVQSEKVLSLKEAATYLPLIDGKKPHISTLWRWSRKGLRGIHLEYARFGSRIVTSSEALTRFVNALAATDTRPGCSTTSVSQKIIPTEKNRADAIKRSTRTLARRGL